MDLLTTVEKESSETPVLLIDRKGSIGLALYERIKKELLTVFVSGVQPQESENLIFIPYKTHIPEIPNGQYALILFVYDAEKDAYEIAKKCSEKAKEDGISFVFIVESVETLHATSLQKITDLYEHAYVIVLGELFGQGDSILDQYILQAGTKRSVKLPHMGLRKIHPVLFSDAIQGILQVLFAIQKREKITLLYSAYTYTDLSIVHMLQKIDPLLQIDFLKEGKKKDVETLHATSLQNGSYFFDKGYPVQEKIITVYKDLSARYQVETRFVSSQEIERVASPRFDLDDEKKIFNPAVKKWGGMVVYCILVAFFIPLLGFGVSILIAATALTQAKADFGKGNLTQVKQQLALAHESFVFDGIVKQPLLFGLQMLGRGKLSQQLDNKITTGKEITETLENLFNSEEKLVNIVNGKAVLQQSDAATIVSLVRQSIVSLQQIATDSDERELVAKIGKYQKGIDMLSCTIDLLPRVLATQGKRTYLVLFENNMELRPGGGFIGSYGLVTFDQGKLIDFTVHDVYDADGQLREHVDPPFAIRRFMGIVHLYLRDSNFDPDFVVDAQTASTMLKKETGQAVDGVMSVDLTFVKYLLSATGPLYIPENNVTVTADNFFLLAETHAEKNSFPGSTQKKDFLSNVLLSLQNRLQSQKKVSMSVLAEKTIQAISEKHILFALANIHEQNILTTNQLSSSLWDPRQQDVGVITDYMGLNEANIGVNKVNYFMKRSLKQAISIDGDGTMKEEVQATYANTSKPNEWPGGDYKNYMRLIVPKETVLTGVYIDGEKQATRSAVVDPLLYESKGFKQPSELEIEQTEEAGKSIYGFLVTVPAASAKTVKITYEHTQKINLSNPVLHYSLALYKQPGTSNDPYSFSFNFPLEYSLLSASPKNMDGNSDYTLDTQLSEDKVISVDLTKK